MWDAKPEKTARETVSWKVSQISIRARKKQMLGEDIGEFTDDRPWLPEDTIERFRDGGKGGRASSILRNKQSLWEYRSVRV